ncbi:hypothetical protein [Xanthomonas floridensis]|uniref:hypothetical protein n=1 Tax=Xanthomonas floridensis TaxID=1843580 RepID=UPI00128FD3DF|nr:hypothetical protein [Xanthomonas floridensis]
MNPELPSAAQRLWPDTNSRSPQKTVAAEDAGFIENHRKRSMLYPEGAVPDAVPTAHHVRLANLH